MRRHDLCFFKRAPAVLALVTQLISYSASGADSTSIGILAGGALYAETLPSGKHVFLSPLGGRIVLNRDLSPIFQLGFEHERSTALLGFSATHLVLRWYPFLGAPERPLHDDKSDVTNVISGYSPWLAGGVGFAQGGGTTGMVGTLSFEPLAGLDWHWNKPYFLRAECGYLLGSGGGSVFGMTFQAGLVYIF